MRITESQLRSLIRNVLLTESAKGPNDLPPNISVMVSMRGTGGTATFFDTVTGKKKIEAIGKEFGGLISWQNSWQGPCVVSIVNDTTPGFGPLLYDVAMEMAGEKGLMSDRRTVTTDARIIWDYYDTRRPDVRKKQMDNPDNELTPEPEDNMIQISAELDMGRQGWSRSSLSRAYFASGTPTLDALRSAGKLIVK